MKKSLFVMPILAVTSFAGCSSNTSAPVDTATTSSPPAGTTAPGANGIPTPFVRAPGAGASSTGNVAPPVPAPKIGGSTANSPGAKMPEVPPGMTMGSSMALPASPDLDKKIAALQNGDKKKLAQAYADRGTLRMNEPNALPRVKYRAALADYRLALLADPKNPEALANKKQIEDIYKMMGRPIPQ